MKSVLGLSVAVSLLALVAPAAAQTGAIVQQTPPSLAVERLNQNLNRLSRQPTDMEALIGAGNASYELGDAQAANGFFTRANMVNARDGRAKLGLALVSLDLKQPREAAAYFDEAEALGVRADKYMAERALAYDLTGQQDKAQRDYAIALQADPGNANLTRAYAISLGISGKLDVAEQQLRPLLFKSDRAAWRDRTMILAMNGHVAEARRVAQTIMPRNLSEAMDPYLIRMGSLTAAQKAAAVHYGQFPADGLRLATVTTPPAAAQVTARAESSARRTSSRDRRKGAVAAAQPTAPAEDSGLAAAMPRGDAPPAMVQAIPAQVSAEAAPSPASRGSNVEDDDPDGWTPAERRVAERRAQTARATDRKSPASPAATVAMVQPIPQPSPPAPQASGAARTAQPVQTTEAARAQQPVQMATATPASGPAPARSAPMQGPTPTGSAMGGVITPAPTPTPVPATPPATESASSTPAAPPASSAPQPGFSAAPAEGAAPAPKRQRTLAEIMAGIEVPESERVAAPQLVDLNEVAQMQAAKRKAIADKAKKEAAAKAKAEAAAKAKAEAEEKARLKANPARIWVQVATGKDPAALAFDMRRLRKTYSALSNEDSFTAEWGATRRLLVGPYATQAKAKALLTDLKKAGSDGFVWQSEAGEEVAPLSGK